jgi:hypothetical protein
MLTLHQADPDLTVAPFATARPKSTQRLSCLAFLAIPCFAASSSLTSRYPGRATAYSKRNTNSVKRGRTKEPQCLPG